MAYIKWLLRVAKYGLLILIVSFGLALSGGVPIPRPPKKEDRTDFDMELVEPFEEDAENTEVDLVEMVE